MREYKSFITWNKKSNETEVDQEPTSEEMFKKMCDPSFLPSRDDLLKKFKKFEGSNLGEKDRTKWWNFVDDDDETNEIIYEIWTKEYIDAFGNYLAQRVDSLGGNKNNPTMILEVGAGNGRLTHFLQEKLNELIPGKVKIVATDSGDWKIKPTFSVENISHQEALKKYQPQIVLFSWMPPDYDCTKEFRATDSVEEYVLIGEAEIGGCSGRDWETWGEESYNENHEGETPPYQTDGFTKEFKNDLTALQLSRLSIMNDPDKDRTSTVSFKREK